MKRKWTFTIEVVIGFSLVMAMMSLSRRGYAQSGATYYVATSGSDSNNGSKTSPWRTISHAGKVVAPGDTVHVLPGVYRESVFLDNSGTSSQRIRFISDTPWKAQVTGDGSGNPAIQIRKANYVDIVGFEVTNVNGYIGIETLASYSQIVGNLVHDVSGGCKQGRFGLGGAGINLVPPGHDVDVIGNVVHDVGDYLNPHGCEGTHGMYVENAPSPNAGGYSTRASNNILYRNESDGITSWHCATQMVLVNNLIFENGKMGILVAANDRGCLNDNSIINNNIVVHNGWHDFCTSTNPSQCPIGNHSGKGGIEEGGLTGRNNRYANNLSYQNLYNGAQDDAIHLSTGTQSNNIVGVDPQFVNYQPDGSGDYHLKPSSPAIDKGTSAVQAPSYDFDNQARPYGAGYDIGAYEWRPGNSSGALLSSAGLSSSSSSEALAPTREPKSGNEDLGKFEGLFVSANPPAQVSIRLQSGRLIAAALHEPGQPSYPLVAVSPTRFRLDGAPPDYMIEFNVSTNGVQGLTVERGKLPTLHLVPQKDLSRFEGLFVSANPPAKIRIQLESGKLIATALHEPGQPSYPLVAVSPTRFRLDGAPPDYMIEFNVSTNGVQSLTVERGKLPAVRLVPEH